ncbi:uncharacterized protein LACBIDRAFT_297708 [Laccaria bicolor S238N-H82]|uniref:Predicted protein n=1 Tax=Laccaria bicolor (strain S238N-H82 / ATCC MYA-4686) TaxID=486041 RepID=B0DBU1_LACBS|nr:uncharacterized protein LACBIDRAFT_297708 [Laccaria bicolor S238N-H82]EDR08241.1 predicted protein [Laccaria bicolor S238N-H82]|eukprot:XP_001881311.1 predicted protein [Laccaria bicolor S238N-H82]
MSVTVTYVKVNCHCGNGALRVAFRTDSLPISCTLCHCNKCRHVTGKMAFYVVPIVGKPLDSVADHAANLQRFTSYKPTPTETRYFCPLCSAHLLVRYTSGPQRWAVSGGALDRVDGIIKIDSHTFVADTLDGGLANIIKEIDGVKLPRYSKGVGSELVPMGWRSEKLSSPQGELTAYCHCGTIGFKFSRPSELSYIPHAPYPDFIYPMDVTHLAKLRNPTDDKWWLRESTVPGEPAKYLGAHCVCHYCRLAGGCDIQSIAFVSRANMHEIGTNEVVDYFHEENRQPGLKQYQSSPGRYREYCGTCGAFVVWWHAGRPDVVDISTGLLDQKEDGVRAEHWIEWFKNRVAFQEKAVNVSIAKGLVDGLKQEVVK